MVALEKTNNQDLIRHIILTEKDIRLRKIAVEKTDDQALISRIILGEK